MFSQFYTLEVEPKATTVTLCSEKFSLNLEVVTAFFLFADLLFRPWHIPQDTCRAKDSFRRHQTHPYTSPAEKCPVVSSRIL